MQNLAFVNDIWDLGSNLWGFFNAVVPVIIGLAVLVFLWGIFTYILNGGDEKKREEMKPYMLWGIVGIVVMVSIWGIINVLAGSLGLTLPHGLLPTLPRVGQ